MNRLSAEGFADLRPNREGAFVAPMGFGDFAQLIEAHQFCEAMLGHRLAFDHPGFLEDLHAIQKTYVEAVDARDFLRITQITISFHMRFYATLDNAFIETFALKVHRHIARVLNYTYQNELPEVSHQAEQFRLNLAQHVEILKAVADRDRPRLSALLLDHARCVQHRLTHLIERRGLPDAMSCAPGIG